MGRCLTSLWSDVVVKRRRSSLPMTNGIEVTGSRRMLWFRAESKDLPAEHVRGRSFGSAMDLPPGELMSSV